MEAQEKVAVVGAVSGNRNSLFVPGTIERVPVSMLIDSGAAVTVISPRIYAKMLAQVKKRLTATKWCVRSAGGDNLSVEGQVELKLQTSQSAWPLTALVADIEEDGILGMDCLGEAVIDCKQRTLSISNELILLVGEPMSGPERKCFRIHLNETIELSERSEAWVSGTVDCKNRQPALWLVESGENENQIQVEDALAEQDEDGVVYLRVMNNSDFPRKLRKGMKVAQCESVQEETAGNIRMMASDKTPRVKRMPDHLRSLFNDATEFMVPEEAQSVRQLLKYQHVFSAGPDDLGKTELVKHKIDTGDNSPIKMAPRRIPLAKQADATRCLQEMKEQGIIKASNSPWSAPIVLVKKDNTTRFCVDYRALNEASKRDSFPLPRIDTVLDSLAGSSWFSTLDMNLDEVSG